jgi:hypothetical protein
MASRLARPFRWPTRRQLAEPESPPPIPLPADGAERYTAPDGSFVDVTVDIEYAYEDAGQSMGTFIRTTATRLARESIFQYLGDDPTQYIVKVDGVQNAPLFGRSGDEFPQLIEALPIALGKALIPDLQRAFNIIMAHLRSKVPSSFNPRYSTGFYETSGFTSRFFTVLVAGKPASPIDWTKVGGATNIQIFSRARYASPLESMKDGGLFAAAAVAASKLPNVSVNFSYRDPTKFGQIRAFSKAGKPYNPLAVPVIEIGTILSNVRADIRPVSRNLSYRRESPKGSQNLIYGRRLLPESRKTNPRRYLTTRTR